VAPLGDRRLPSLRARAPDAPTRVTRARGRP
jgi:hypothetical protein